MKKEAIFFLAIFMLLPVLATPELEIAEDFQKMLENTQTLQTLTLDD